MPGACRTPSAVATAASTSAAPARGQLYQPRAVGERPATRRATSGGQPGLAHPARPGHRHQPVLVQQPRDLATSAARPIKLVSASGKPCTSTGDACVTSSH